MDVEELLKKGLKELGYVPETDIVRSFMTYLAELKRWNRAYNLTSLKKDEDVIIKHFLDSLLYLKAISNNTIRVADVGSGAGFPGVPIKIIRPEIEMCLIEPSQKKCAFLSYIIRKLTLKRIEVIEKRIEEIKVNQELVLPVDVAVTRALFSIKNYLKKTSHIVRQGGILILSKGPKVKDEINMLKDIRYEILTLRIPLSDIKRYIVKVRLQ